MKSQEVYSSNFYSLSLVENENEKNWLISFPNENEFFGNIIINGPKFLVQKSHCLEQSNVPHFILEYSNLHRLCDHFGKRNLKKFDEYCSSNGNEKDVLPTFFLHTKDEKFISCLLRELLTVVQQQFPLGLSHYYILQLAKSHNIFLDEQFGVKFLGLNLRNLV